MNLLKSFILFIFSFILTSNSYAQAEWEIKEEIKYNETFETPSKSWPSVFNIKSPSGEHLIQIGSAIVENKAYHLKTIPSKEVTIYKEFTTLIGTSNYLISIDFKNILCQKIQLHLNDLVVSCYPTLNKIIIKDTEFKNQIFKGDFNITLRNINNKIVCLVNNKAIYEETSTSKVTRYKISVENGSLSVNKFRASTITVLETQKIIDNYVSSKMEKWMPKDKYEKQSDYVSRTSAEKIKLTKAEFRQEIINQMAIKTIDCKALTNHYNAEEEYFTLHHPNLNDIYVHIALDEAKALKENFCLFDLKNPTFYLNEKGFYLHDIEMINRVTGKKYYAYDSVSTAQHYIKKKNSNVVSVFDEATMHQLEYTKNYCLVIGVQDYNDTRIASLDNPISDCQKMVNALTEHYTFYQENVTFLRNPTHQELIQAFDDITRKVKPTDNLLIFYAGHGIFDKELEKGYWLPANANKDNRANWFPNSLLKDYISGIKSKHTLLISDACFSGSIFKTRDAFQNPQTLKELAKLKSRKAITSGAMSTVPDKSVFVKYLIQRLEENTQKTMLAEELFTSFRIAVINNSPNSQIPLYGDIKDTGDEGGDFIFIKK